MSSDWVKYCCKSGQTLFIYNKVTGEHRWVAEHSNDSIQDHINNGQPIPQKEVCDVCTQTDDFGCNNGCTSMYVDTNLDLLANSVISISMSGLGESINGGDTEMVAVNNVHSVQVTNNFVPPNCSAIVESNSQHVNKRRRLINVNVVNGKHTTIGKYSASNKQEDNASASPQLLSESLPSSAQEAQTSRNKLTSINSGDGTSSTTGINSVSTGQVIKGKSPSYTNNMQGTPQEYQPANNMITTGTDQVNGVNIMIPTISSVSSIKGTGTSIPLTNSNEINVHQDKQTSSIITYTSTVNHNSSLPVMTSVSTQAKHDNLPQICTKGLESKPQMKQVNRRKRFLFTNYIPKGKHLVKDISKDSVKNIQAPSPPSCGSRHVVANSQERSLNDEKTNASAEHDSNKGAKDTIASPHIPADCISPEFPNNIENESHDDDPPPVVIANVFSYATGKVYTACQDEQKEQCLMTKVPISGNEINTATNPVPKALTNPSYDPSLEGSEKSTTEEDEIEQSLGEHRTLIAQQLKCGNCNRDFNSRAHLDEHLKIYTGDQPFKCCYCGMCFTDNGDLLVHLRTHMTAKPYKCSHCDKAFRHSSSLSVHLKLHTGEKSYKCPSCDRTFRQKIHLRNHLRVHTTELQFKCSDCDKRFKSNSELVVHLLSHSGIRPYKCSYCDRLFSQECHLKSHERAHCKQKTDQCPHCDKVFKFGSSLTLHLRTHTGERPYKCSQCDLTFRQKQHLIVHVRRHTGEKPFVCQHCGKAFRHDTGLRSHLLIHPESDYSKAQKEMYTDDQLLKKVE